MKSVPDYSRIYRDLIVRKHPDKWTQCEKILSKSLLSVLDIIKINTIIAGNETLEDEIFNQKHRSYNKSTILQILDYQKNNGLNNVQLASHYKISRNTITKWKREFL